MSLSGHWWLYSQKRQSKPKSYIYIYGWNTDIPTHFTLVGISTSIWRLKLQWGFQYKFICLGCRTWNWFSHSSKGKLNAILRTFWKKLQEQLGESGIQCGWPTASYMQRSTLAHCYLLWRCVSGFYDLRVHLYTI